LALSSLIAREPLLRLLDQASGGPGPAPGRTLANGTEPRLMAPSHAPRPRRWRRNGGRGGSQLKAWLGGASGRAGVVDPNHRPTIDRGDRPL